MHQQWKFLLDSPHESGWVVQRVVNVCTLGKCQPPWVHDLRTTCTWPDGLMIKHPCSCGDYETKTFVYFEAWYYQKNKTRPLRAKGSHDDKAQFGPEDHGCGSYQQLGEIRFYSENDANDIVTKPNVWIKSPPKVYYGMDTACSTTPLFLVSFDGGTSDDPKYPTFWDEEEHGADERSFEADWMCCKKTCPSTKNTATATATPSK